MATGGTSSSSDSLSIWKLSAGDWAELSKHLNLHGAWYQLVSHISEFPVHGYRSGSGLTTSYYRTMLQKAFKDDCISRSQSGKLHKAFKEGREEVADEPRSGRPTTARTDEDVDRVLEVLRTDRRLSIQQIADTLHMSTFVVHGIVTEDLQMRKKARMSKSRIKTMIIVFFDIRGIVHCEFVPQGQTVNSVFYLEVLRRLKRRISRVRTDIKDTVKLHHDNATSHTAFIITNFLARSNTPLIPDPPYSPDLAPCDFFLFPRLKREMKGKHWETVENTPIQHHVTTFLRSIPVEESSKVQRGIQIGVKSDTLYQIKTCKGMYNGAEDILLEWASRNGSVNGLFRNLAKMDFQIGMQILKNYVDPKYHLYLKKHTEDSSSFSFNSYDYNANKIFKEDDYYSKSQRPVFRIFVSCPSLTPVVQHSNQLGATKLSPCHNNFHQSSFISPNLDSQRLRKAMIIMWANTSLVATRISKVEEEHKLNNLDAEPKLQQLKVMSLPPKRSKSSASGSSSGSTLREEDMGDILCVPFEEIVAATDNFNERNVLGKGGFGIVYKGTWKKNTVAIKCLKLKNEKPSGPEISQAQLLTELRILKQARIDNILNLYGVCLREDYPCLIYQFMPNGSLEDRLLCKVSQCCVTLFFSP
ncbi:hypothetical protein LAZ67_6003859 [Cordylochernes scorpioides]|uniref:Protein kinase domain-containing protein n=1 Tax=Cordylochernes scorpioides TaxID=51811 RepID=A0ABY6KQY3_9ARAC|nr:hypothetical protein LAZ67_6003859 [Cordylochernes scorpioides]